MTSMTFGVTFLGQNSHSSISSDHKASKLPKTTAASTEQHSDHTGNTLTGVDSTQRWGDFIINKCT